MTRRNPALEELERQNEALRADIKRMRKDPGEIPFVACDNSCIVAHPFGMHTNGGCRCDERRLRHAVMWWKARAKYLEFTIELMNNGESDGRQ